MTRTFTTTALVLILLVGTLSAEPTSPEPTETDPIASLTARILSQFLPRQADESRKLDELSQDDDQTDEALTLRLQPLPILQQPLEPALARPLWLVPTRQTTLPAPVSALSAIERMSRQMAMLAGPLPAQDKDAPLAFSAASANGSYAIEAVVPTDDGPQKVKLNGTRSEIEDQFKALPETMQRSLGPRLGL